MDRPSPRTGALARLIMIAAALSGLIAPAALAHEGAGPADPAHPVDQPSLGLVYEGLQWDASGSCAGGYRLIFTSDCTHGPDPITAEAVTPSLTPVAGSDLKVECDGNGTSGKRVQVMYVHATDVADQYATMKPKIGVHGHVACGLPGQERTEAGGVTKSSCTPMPRGFLARGFVACSTKSGTITQRAQ